MEVIYKGPSPLLYRSAPSLMDYMFMPGEAMKVHKDDEHFFKNMSNAPGSLFECVGLKEKIVKKVNKSTKDEDEGIIYKVKDLLDDGELNDSVKGGKN